jgi:hypothetical protein
VDRHFGGIGAGDQVDRAQQVQELLAGNPAPAPDYFILHYGDVRGGSAEGGRSQSQEQACQLPENAAIGPDGLRRFNLHFIYHVPLPFYV